MLVLDLHRNQHERMLLFLVLKMYVITLFCCFLKLIITRPFFSLVSNLNCVVQVIDVELEETMPKLKKSKGVVFLSCVCYIYSISFVPCLSCLYN